MQKTVIVVSCAIMMLTLGIAGSAIGQGSRTLQEPSRAASSATTQTPPTTTPTQPKFVIDFSGYAGEPIDEWLKSKGFKLEEDAKDRDRLALSIKSGALVLEAKDQVRGFIIKDGLHLTGVTKVGIEWGVIKYPEGASYEKEVRNEPIMIYFFFGEEKIASGHLLSPDLPYFIGLYLCQNDKIGVPYKGRAYHEGGRFVCVGNPPPQETIVTEFDLDHAFRTYFEKTEVPPISGLAIAMDTSSSGDGGKAAGYVRRIAFLE
jgi:hypothetical protein